MRRVMLACLALAACRAFDASGGGEPGTEGDAPGTPDALPRAAETDDASTAPEPATSPPGVVCS